MNVTLCGKNCAGTILYIGGFELPDKNAAAQRVLANAKLFRAIGYNTVFVGINKEIEYKIELDLTKKVYDDFVMYSVPYPKNMWQWINYLTNPEPYIFMAQKIKDLKVIICYNFPSINLEKIRRYCKRNNIKCIADVTEWYSGLGRSVPVKVLKGMDTFYRMCIVQKKLQMISSGSAPTIGALQCSREFTPSRTAFPTTLICCSTISMFSLIP